MPDRGPQIFEFTSSCRLVTAPFDVFAAELRIEFAQPFGA
jgi:hypothetical protein